MSKLPGGVKMVAYIAGGLGVVQSLLWVSMGALAVTSYLNCGFNQPSHVQSATSNFTAVIRDYFFLNEYCPSYQRLDGVISSSELHVWAASTVATSGLWLIISSCLFIFVTDDNVENVNTSLYAWSLLAVTVSSCDLALGILFGLSFSAVGNLMDSYTAESELADLLKLSVLRGATFTLMLISLRGFVLLLANIALVVAILYSAYLVNQSRQTNEHAIHSIGPLYAFNQGPSKHGPEPWTTIGVEYDNHHAGHINRAYSRSKPEKQRGDWGRRLTDSTTQSYKVTQKTESLQSSKTQPTRPFSYLEDPLNKSSTPSSPSTQDSLPPWKRNNLADLQLDLPSPDYSPPQSRQPRLKSALKLAVY